MLEKIEQLTAEINGITASNAEEAENLRIKYLSKKGSISVLFDEFKNIPNDQKKNLGKVLNELKTLAQDKINTLKESFESDANNNTGIDLTLPGNSAAIGGRHPLSLVKNEIVDIFARLGFTVAEGPEIEDDWHVFTALNFPLEHPARDMQDTFFINKNPDILLRTHTSSVQVRVMEKEQPPIRAIFPGRVFRNEAISARAHCIFHQVEGLYIDQDVSFADLKQTLLYFAKEMFGQDTQIRLRPSFFHSPNHRQRWTSAAPSAEAKVATFAKDRAGWKFLAAEWSILPFWMSTTSTAKNTPDLPLAWALNALPCCATK